MILTLLRATAVLCQVKYLLDGSKSLFSPAVNSVGDIPNWSQTGDVTATSHRSDGRSAVHLSYEEPHSAGGLTTDHKLHIPTRVDFRMGTKNPAGKLFFTLADSDGSKTALQIDCKTSTAELIVGGKTLKKAEFSISGDFVVRFEVEREMVKVLVKNKMLLSGKHNLGGEFSVGVEAKQGKQIGQYFLTGVRVYSMEMGREIGEKSRDGKIVWIVFLIAGAGILYYLSVHYRMNK